MNLFESIKDVSKKFFDLDVADSKKRKQFIGNSVGYGEEDKPIMGDISPNDYNYFGAHSSHIAFAQFFEEKAQRVFKYREMATFPEIGLAIDILCDEAICKNSKGDSFSFRIADTSKIKRRDLNKLEEEFDFVINELLNFKEMGWDLFNKWLTDGELFLEAILTKDKENIIGFKPLPSYTMVPYFEGGVITNYQQIDVDKTTTFSPSQILYSNYGKFGKNRQDARGYLDNSIKLYNQLRNLEDSVVIYRLVRAPERRVWNIEVGNAPAGKAEEIVKQTMNRYKNNLNYDSVSGTISSSQHIQALTEDFWFSQREGSGSSVDTIQGGLQLGEMEDVNFFLKKLYKSLKIPPTRWGEDIGTGGSQYTNNSDIEREELNFTKFVERLQNKFKIIVEEAFILNLKVKGYPEELWDRKLYDITMIMNNQFREFREIELISSKLDMMSQYEDLIMSKENPNGKISEEFFMKYIVNLPGNLNEKNRELLEIERQKIEDSGGFEEDDF